MTMQAPPPISNNNLYLPRRRLAIIGPSKSGKSTSWLMMAEKMLDRGVKFITIEGDDGLSTCLDEFPRVKQAISEGQFKRLPLVTQWSDFWGNSQRGVGQVKEWVRNNIIGPNDVVITEAIDIITTDLIRGEWINKAVVQRDQIRAANNKAPIPTSWESKIAHRAKGEPPIDTGDWGAINGEIEDALLYLNALMPCSWIATTDIETIRESQSAANNDDAQVKELYRQMGMTVKMSGYKWLMRYFDTIVQTGKSPPNNYSFMVYGSRGSRALLNGASQTMMSASPNQDFYEQFGKKFLGW